ncbi:MAG: inorganic phosphate transporter [Microbacteriaceae bacterium]
MAIAIIIAAVLFALVHGLNTGASLLATSLNIRGISLNGALIIMTLGVAIAPFLFGLAVANTLAHDLVPFSGEQGQRGMLVAVVVTIAVILVLSWLRVPSSLTLALVAAIAGYGFVAVGVVEWGNISKVLATMFLAPIVGALLAYAISRFLLPLLPQFSVRKSLERGHIFAFSLLSLSYGSNDAQKMIAVAMIALGFVSGGISALWWVVLACALTFGIGSRLGVGRMAKTISTGVLPAAPTDMVVTEVSSSIAMLLSTSIGSPVGLAQTMSGSLIGAGLSQGYGKIRWQEVWKILIAWVVTLPVTFAIASLIGLVVR